MFRINILKFPVIMFNYMKWYGDKLVQNSTLHPAGERSERLSRLRRERQETMKRIKGCFRKPLRWSYIHVHSRKQEPFNVINEYYDKYSDIIRDCLNELSAKIKKDQSMASRSNIIAFATSYYNLGIIYKEGKCSNLSRKLFLRCYKLLKEKRLNRRAILIAVKTLIVLSEIAKEEKETEEEWRWLNAGINLCLRYIERDNLQEPICVELADAYVKIEKQQDMKIILMSLYASMIDRMKMLYYEKTEYRDKGMNIVHKFLNKRARVIQSLNERCEWSSSVIVTSLRLLTNQRFTEARDCLAAAKYMMELVERDPSLHTINNIVTELKARLADAWHTYAVQILKVSYHQETRGRKQNKSPVLNQEEPTNLLLFTSLAEDLVDISNRITDSCVSDVNEAQIVFRYAAK
ncbi:uncharacterized protein LOC105278885 isoform X1 [Ooceraea biroi]|nr:uncharacterized protein LOC105278885 isoform X1 [Ooceraea biroi]